MRYGLLAGLGAGLSQAANTLNQGMAEDRAVRREAEREARREAIEAAKEKAAEKRWRESFEFQKQQLEEQRLNRKEDIAYRNSRDSIADDRYSTAEKRSAIDSEVKFILDDYNFVSRSIAQQATEEIRAAQKEVELLTRAQKSADPMAMLSAEGVNVNPENITGRINALNRQIGAIRTEQKAKLEALRVERDNGLATIKSHYGDAVSKSSFAATLSTLGLPKEEVKEVTEFAFSHNTQAIAGDLSLAETPAKPQPPAPQPPKPAPGLLGITPEYSTDDSGAPELTLRNLMRKWNQTLQPGAATPEMEQNAQRLRDKGIQSAYGAAALNQRR